MIDEVDLDRFGVKVKHQPFVSIIQGLLFFSKGKLEFSRLSPGYVSLFHRAIQFFEMCLQSDPANFMTLIHCAQSYYYLMRPLPTEKASQLDHGREEDTFARGENYYLRAIQVMPNNEIPLLLYGRYLEETGRIDKADRAYLRGLDLNPFSVPLLRRYASLLRKIGELDMSDKFEKRSYLIEAAAGILFSDLSESQKYLASFLD